MSVQWKRIWCLYHKLLAIVFFFSESLPGTSYFEFDSKNEYFSCLITNDIFAANVQCTPTEKEDNCHLVIKLWSLQLSKII